MNKRIVREFYDMAFNGRKPAEAASKYLGRVYRQHNPGAGDGPEAFVEFASEFVNAYPSLRFEIKRVIAEGDLVATHSHRKLHPGDRGAAVMDIFRVENGKIVEHWDAAQEVPARSENPNTMF